LRLDPREAGLLFVPAGVAFSASALWARSLFGRFGIAAPLSGCAVTATAAVALLALIADRGTSAPALLVSGLVATMSVGNGLVLPTLMTVALSDVPPGVAGAASGLVITVQQFASAAGIAVVGTLLFAVARRTGGATGVVHGVTAAIVVDLVLVGCVAGSIALIGRATVCGATGCDD
jgi:hypothetical protein